MTDDLINRLAVNAKPVSADAMRWLFLRHATGGVVAGLAIMLLFLGIRHDLSLAMTTVSFWTKFFYGIFLLLILVPAVFVLSRPIRSQPHWRPVVLLLVCLMGAALYQWESVAPEQRDVLLWGHTALVCPWLIVLISLPMLASLLVAMRRLAPAHPALAGFAAGIVSGSSGALVYSLHCPETGIPFVAAWYTLGIAITGLLGLIGGRIWLRW
ncbi:NrsF family protein [Brucella grignonensis]|uniref:Extracytoplasmic function alternative sigma factor n=1 Tax=Brucella grignonensis TaxID=94627 RepID=A0A256EYE6_9HYPH|nr:NrsF family protein [Brucella grignonensis]OYR07648.1 hypothetical protein CEV33_3704 [Brucella grignonensis]